MKIIVFVSLVLVSIFAQNAGAYELRVEIENKKVRESVVYCGVFIGEEGFPDKNEKSYQSVSGSTDTNGATFCIFKDVPQNQIAVSVLEDLNGNKVLDTNFVGYPKEPWGVSKNAPMHTFGPPKFNEASFELKKDEYIKIKLNR